MLACAGGLFQAIAWNKKSSLNSQNDSRNKDLDSDSMDPAEDPIIPTSDRTNQTIDQSATVLAANHDHRIAVDYHNRAKGPN